MIHRTACLHGVGSNSGEVASEFFEAMVGLCMQFALMFVGSFALGDIYVHAHQPLSAPTRQLHGTPGQGRLSQCRG